MKKSPRRLSGAGDFYGFQGLTWDAVPRLMSQTSAAVMMAIL